MRQEKRRYPRSTATYDYFLSWAGRTLSGKTLDVSPFGMGITLRDPLPPGERVELKIMIPSLGFLLETAGEVRYCQKLPTPSASLCRAGISFVDTSEKGLPFIVNGSTQSRHTPSQVISIEAPAPFCYRLLCAFERYPEWVSRMEAVKVIDRYADGRARNVEFHYDFFFRKFCYKLEYTYNNENCLLSWSQSGGDRDILEIGGAWGFKPTGAEACIAAYEVKLTLGFVPSPRLVKFGTFIMMRREMKNFKEFAEREKKSGQAKIQ